MDVLSQEERKQEMFCRGTYNIALRNGPKAVKGDVLGNYGVHKKDSRHWPVTYIPTGEQIGTFNTRTGARIVARFWHIEAGDQYPPDMSIVKEIYKLQFLRVPRFDSEGVPPGYDRQGRLMEGEEFID